jgi:hypothetical protein
VGKFVKGQSGNPGGRPKKVKEIEDLALEATPECLKILIKIAKRESEDSRARIAAIKEILDRGLGKAVQKTEVALPDNVLEKIVDGPPQETYEEWKARKDRERKP